MQILHYTRVRSAHSQTRYLASTAVLLVELAKLAISLTFTIHENSKADPSLSVVAHLKTISKSIFRGDSYKLACPAFLYTIQSYLVYAAVGNLSVATFQVTYQLKILTTVLFSAVMLKKRPSPIRWLALVLLTVGITIVQVPGAVLPTFNRYQHDTYQPNAGERATDVESLVTRNSMNTLQGLAAVLSASLISGFTGVYFEKVVKENSSSVPIWTRNVQLSIYSLVLNLLVGVIYKDGAEIYRNGFFMGYTKLVWVTIALQAGGGLIVAMCIVLVDNVVKNFAVSISIVISFLVEVLVFNTPVTINVSANSIVFSELDWLILLTRLCLVHQSCFWLRTCIASHGEIDSNHRSSILEVQIKIPLQTLVELINF